MSLTTYTQQRFQPTNDQILALDALYEFLESETPCFLLKGYAGTGKTTITKHIVGYLTEQSIRTFLMAPTGRAARILSQKTGLKAATIHRGIYNLNELDEIEVGNGDRKTYKFRYGLRRDDTPGPVVFLIDEASLISDQYSEGDFFVFGSGRLLSDLMQVIAPNNLGRRDKIIFIGDDAQLPPVTDKSSRALAAAYLQDQFQIDVKEYQLTEVVRQQAESGILANATYLRNQLLIQKRNSFELNTKFGDVQVLDVKDVVNNYLRINPELRPEGCVIINHSNRAALEFNLAVRERLFADRHQIEPGDILIVAQNNYNHKTELLNGMSAKVLRVDTDVHLKSNLISYNAKGDEARVSHSFRNVTIAVQNDEGIDVELNCLILDQFLYSDEPQLNYEENLALYLDFKVRHPNLKSKTKEFKDALRSDPWFNAVRVKYGYAATCHKAQGGEWEEAIVNLDLPEGRLTERFLRWTYTAVTRASQKLYLFNVPRQHQFSFLEYHAAFNGATHRNGDTRRAIQVELTEEYHAFARTTGIDAAAPFLQTKAKELFAIAGAEGIRLHGRRALQYCERYTFEREGQRATLDLRYNGSGHFTSVVYLPNETTDAGLAETLRLAIQQPVEIQFIDGEQSASGSASIDASNAAEDWFSEEQNELKVLFNELQPLLVEFDISINNVDHRRFQELYLLARGTEKASIRFWYNGRKQFGRVEPHLPGCNSDDLLRDSEAAIKQLKEL